MKQFRGIASENQILALALALSATQITRNVPYGIQPGARGIIFAAPQMKTMRSSS
jgi:hypothetical protein